MNWETFNNDNKDFINDILGKIPSDSNPEKEDIFRAFDLCPLDQTKVVIVGQDPYHGSSDGLSQAVGLSFSIGPNDPKIPPSLRNIFKVTGKPRKNGDLTPWAKQGVLLLNKTLTVTKGEPNSHKEVWEEYSKRIVKFIDTNTENVIWLLWGKSAQELIPLISNGTILEASHPSPFSFNKGFDKCDHFAECNRILEENGNSSIDWS